MSLLQGFAELEYGMLRYMGAIDDSTPIVTSGKYVSTTIVAIIVSFGERQVLESFGMYFQNCISSTLVDSCLLFD